MNAALERPESEGYLRHPDDLSDIGSGASLAPAASTVSVNPFFRPQQNAYLRGTPQKLGTVNEVSHPPSEGYLRHPDDLSDLGSATSLPPAASTVSANPFFRPQQHEYLSGDPSKQGTVIDASRPVTWATSGNFPSMTGAASDPSQDYGASASSWGQPQNNMVPSLPLTSLSSESVYSQPADPAQNTARMQSWHGSTEIDRLIRERLEGQHSVRANTAKSAQRLAESHETWGFQAVHAAVEGFWGTLAGLQYGGDILLGRVPAPDCKRMQQTLVVHIGGEDEGEPTYFQDPGEEFAGLLTAPAAIQEPVPDRIRTSALPMSTPIGTEGLTPSSRPSGDASHFAPPDAAQEERKKPKKGGRGGDRASALSMAPNMTSSAAALLGGLATKGAAESAEPESAAPKRQVRPGDSKTVLAPSSMQSGAASSLSAFMNKPPAAESNAAVEAEDPELAAAIRASMEDAAPQPPEASPKKSAQAKSVLAQSTVMKSSAAGALGGFVAANTSRTADPADSAAGATSSESPSTSTARKAPAKSVLAQSTVMKSSAAGALGGIVAAGGTRTAPRPADPPAAAAVELEPVREKPEERSESASRSRKPDDRKSALAASTVMTSSAASTLAGLSAAPKRAPEAERAPTEAEAPAAGSMQAKPQHAAGSAAGAKPKPKVKAQTVISGLNTTSSASALLGPLAQAKSKSKPK